MHSIALEVDAEQDQRRAGLVAIPLPARSIPRHATSPGPGTGEIDRARPAEPADEALVAAVARGDEAALDALYDRYARPVFSLASRVAQDWELAEEITQEVFLRLWQHAGSYSAARGRFASWLLAITHHLAIDQSRRRKRHRLVVASTSADHVREVPDTRTDVEAAAWLTLQRDLVRRALQQLPAPQRLVIELAYFEGLTHVQIAALLGEPLGTIKTRLRLGLARLRGLLAAPAVGLQA